jgi:hypothetical protein
MRMPGFRHLRWIGSGETGLELCDVRLTHLYSATRFTLDELRTAFPVVAMPSNVTSRVSKSTAEKIIGNGCRNSTLFSIAGSLLRAGLTKNEIVVALNEVNSTRVNPPLPQSEIEAISSSVGRYQSGSFNRNGIQSNRPSKLPPTLDDSALYGLAGDVVRTIEPHTEADNAALLVQFLAGVGCMVGKGPYFRVEADNHYTKLFAAIFGASSKARKGSSWGHIRRLLCRVDPAFANCVQDGLSSGEGLIFHVRDKSTKKSAIKQKGRIVEYQDEITDGGAVEKRAFVIEPEFARVLRAMKRDGNTLSSVIRQAWDSDRLRVLTKTPLHASETQISIIGHITAEELRRNLDETEMSNGFANRFLWVFAKRSKELPHGGDLRESDLNDLVHRLNSVNQHARATNELRLDDTARENWAEVYSDLSRGRPGLLGSVTSRAEAQVMRLACIYALLDVTSVIGPQHLKAALSFWHYCEASASYVFGNQTGDRIADTIYTAILANPDGFSRTQLRDLFSRNIPRVEIDRALGLLIDYGQIAVEKIETDGRPAEVFAPRVTTTLTT